MKDFWLYEDAVNTNDIMITDRRQLHDKHGVVCNPHMRLRERKSQLNSLPSGHVQSIKQESEPAGHNKQNTIEPRRQGEQQPVPKMKEGTSTSNRPAPKTILQSFAKTPISAPPKSTKQMKQTDEPTAALSDDGEPDDTDILSSKSSSALHSKAKSRKDREDALRRMMEEQEGEEEEEEEEEGNKREVIEFASNIEADENPESEPLTDAEPESGIPLTAQADKEPSETISNSGNGRRRGKRRVLKKKRILDDQGYMGMCGAVRLQLPAQLYQLTL